MIKFIPHGILIIKRIDWFEKRASCESMHMFGGSRATLRHLKSWRRTRRYEKTRGVRTVFSLFMRD